MTKIAKIIFFEFNMNKRKKDNTEADVCKCYFRKGIVPDLYVIINRMRFIKPIIIL